METKETVNKEEGLKAEEKAVTLKVKKPATLKKKVKTVTSKAVEHPETTVKKTKVKAVKSTVEKNKQLLIEEVVTKREVKYLYPEDCVDILQKKKFRQVVRNKINKLNAQLNKLKDKESKEYKRIERELRNFSKENVKSAAVV